MKFYSTIFDTISHHQPADQNDPFQEGIPKPCECHPRVYLVDAHQLLLAGLDNENGLYMKKPANPK